MGYAGRLSGLVLGLRPANERRRYFVTTSLIGWVQAKNRPCLYWFIRWDYISYHTPRDPLIACPLRNQNIIQSWITVKCYITKLCQTEDKFDEIHCTTKGLNYNKSNKTHVQNVENPKLASCHSNAVFQCGIAVSSGIYEKIRQHLNDTV